MAIAIRPLHPYSAETKHVGFSLTWQTSCAPSARLGGIIVSHPRRHGGDSGVVLVMSVTMTHARHDLRSSYLALKRLPARGVLYVVLLLVVMAVVVVVVVVVRMVVVVVVAVVVVVIVVVILVMMVIMIMVLMIRTVIMMMIMTMAVMILLMILMMMLMIIVIMIMVIDDDVCIVLYRFIISLYRHGCRQ